jgi:ATP-binding cassette subfamily F protein 3
MILISHDLQFLDAVTNSMMTIHRKSAFKIKGKSEDLFTLIAEEEERHESMRKNLEKKRAHLESFIDRFGAKASKASQANARKKALDKMPALEKLKDLYQLSFSFNQSPFMGKKMLEASSLSFSYDPSQPLISNFSLTIEKGDRIAIIGKNGAGKSTLMKLLAKENQPDSGCVSLSSSACLGYFGQTNIDRLDKTLTIEEEISRANSLLTMTEVRGICGLMMFGKDLAKKKISVLSGGERSRVLIGKIIAEPCNMLFLDEPTHHLDIESIEALIDAIEEFNGSCVIVTHSEWVLRRLPLNKLIICSESGQEVFNGSYDEFLEKQGWDEPKPKKKKEPRAIKTAPAQSISHEKQIKQFEKRLQDLEKDLENNNLLLSTLTPSEGKKKIELLSRIEKIQTEINTIYQSIENLY